jgi:O-antigen/teichoic acid export membrane protein
MDLGFQVLTAFRWVAGAKFLSQLITWGATIAVVRLLTPEDYGLMAMATIFTSFLTMFNEFGLGAALVQKPDVDDLTLRGVFGLTVVFNLVCFILLLGTAPFAAAFFTEPRLAPILRVLSLQFVISPFGVIPQSMLERKLDFKAKSLVDVTVTVASALITLLLAFRGSGVWALVWGSLALTLLRTLGLNLASPIRCRPSFSWIDLRSVVSFGGMITANRLLWIFYSQADMLVIGKFLGKEQLGIYSMAMQLASLPADKANGIINQVAFAAFARAQSELQQVRTIALTAVRSIAFLAFPVFFGIALVADELLAVFFGSAWQAAVLPLQLLSTVMGLRMISNLLHTAVQGLGRPDISVFKLTAASLVMPLAFYFGSVWGGVVGVSLAWVLVYPLAFMLMLWLSLPVVDVRWMELLGALAGPAVASAGMCLVVEAMKIAFMEHMAPGIRLVSLMLIGGIVYGGTAAMLFGQGARETMNLLRRSVIGGVSTVES